MTNKMPETEAVGIAFALLSHLPRSRQARRNSGYCDCLGVCRQQSAEGALHLHTLADQFTPGRAQHRTDQVPKTGKTWRR
jgi:hypothetical protein